MRCWEQCAHHAVSCWPFSYSSIQAQSSRPSSESFFVSYICSLEKCQFGSEKTACMQKTVIAVHILTRLRFDRAEKSTGLLSPPPKPSNDCRRGLPLHTKPLGYQSKVDRCVAPTCSTSSTQLLLNTEYKASLAGYSGQDAVDTLHLIAQSMFTLSWPSRSPRAPHSQAQHTAGRTLISVGQHSDHYYHQHHHHPRPPRCCGRGQETRQARTCGPHPPLPHVLSHVLPPPPSEPPLDVAALWALPATGI